MADTSDVILAALYDKWKSGQKRDFDVHPSEEEFACLFDNRLSPEEAVSVTDHLIACRRCGRILVAESGAAAAGRCRVPRSLVESAKGIVRKQHAAFLQILMEWKDDTLALLTTTGDVLLGQELMPLPVFRSRMIKDLTQGITILKDVLDTRIEIKIERTGGRQLDVTVLAKTKSRNAPLAPARVTLVRDGILLESHTSDAGAAVFTQVVPGNYTITITQRETTVAEIELEIKV